MTKRRASRQVRHCLARDALDRLEEQAGAAGPTASGRLRRHMDGGGSGGGDGYVLAVKDQILTCHLPSRLQARGRTVGAQDDARGGRARPPRLQHGARAARGTLMMAWRIRIEALRPLRRNDCARAARGEVNNQTKTHLRSDTVARRRERERGHGTVA